MAVALVLGHTVQIPTQEQLAIRITKSTLAGSSATLQLPKHSVTENHKAMYEGVGCSTMRVSQTV